MCNKAKAPTAWKKERERAPAQRYQNMTLAHQVSATCPVVLPCAYSNLTVLLGVTAS